MQERANPNSEDLSELREWLYQATEGNWIKVTRSELENLHKEGIINPNTQVGWEGSIPFAYKHIEAQYFYEYQGTTQHAYTEDELHAAAIVENKINASTRIWGKGLPLKGIEYGSFRFTNLSFNPEIQQFIEERREFATTVLSGPNNSGKTLIMKILRRDLGPTVNFLACDRFYHIHRLSPAPEENKGQYVQRHESFITQLYQTHQNIEKSDLQLPQLLSQMKNAQRDSLLDLCSEMLGEKFCLTQVDPENSLSQYYIEVDGQNLAVSSTGTRLLMVIVAACLDEHSDILLIDEPELGLSPRLQTILARYFFNFDLRKKHFPHLRQLFVATHSHLFLDHTNIQNNFVVTKTADEIAISPINSISGYHDLQFNMLGNDLEALFLPTAIIVVEGETDQKYLKRLIQVSMPDKRISVVRSSGEGDTKKKLHVIDDTLGGLAKSPYRERIFILLDKKHSVRQRDFTKYGIPEHNIITLDKNGIEYYYPTNILADIFACSESDLHTLLIIKDNSVRVHDIEMTKTKLCDTVLNRLSPNPEIPTELEENLFNQVAALFLDQ